VDFTGSIIKRLFFLSDFVLYYKEKLHGYGDSPFEAIKDPFFNLKDQLEYLIKNEETLRYFPKRQLTILQQLFEEK
jgi:hypothetical protein